MPMTEKQLAQRDAKRDLGAGQPSGAARTLITIAKQKPKVLQQVFKDLAGAQVYPKHQARLLRDRL